MRTNLGTLALALTSLFAAACSETATPTAQSPEPAPAEQPTAETTPPEKEGDDPSKSDINISDEIRKACGLTDTEAHFAYNSANVQSGDQDVMKKLADCFTTGKLKGRVMRLVGHADPRGESEYNMVLGGRRADNVAQAVTAAGLPKPQVETTSRGEMEARGTDEDSWAADRRVDIHLKAAE